MRNNKLPKGMIFVEKQYLLRRDESRLYGWRSDRLISRNINR